MTEQAGTQGGTGDAASLPVQVVQGSTIPTFVIDRDHRVTHWNRALEVVSGIAASALVGTDRHWSAFYSSPRPCMADLLLDGALADQYDRFYASAWRPSPVLDCAYEAEGFFRHLGEGGLWLYFTAVPLWDDQGRVIGAMETLQDITARKRAEEELERYRLGLEERVLERTRELTEANRELKEMNRRLEEAHLQLLQAEKMASIGQLAAGVAHEINNPIGFVSSNLGSLESYFGRLMQLIEVYESHEDALADRLAHVAEAKRSVDFDYIRSDLADLLAESKDGLARVKKIVQDLKDFSHVGAAEWTFADLHAGIDSTLNIVSNEIKYKARVVREYGQLPEVECLPLEMNQVFMNLLVNAAQAIRGDDGEIRIRTGTAGDEAWVEVADNGCGIAPGDLARIFDPFFTTKPVGTGTGLGLSLSYSIVNKHHGRIEVDSHPGAGTRFRVWLPLRQPRPVQENSA